MKFYIAVLESDTEQHFFQTKANAAKYLVQNCVLPNCELEEMGDNAELWNETGESVGYYYCVKFED